MNATTTATAARTMTHRSPLPYGGEAPEPALNHPRYVKIEWKVLTSSFVYPMELVYA